MAKAGQGVTAIHNVLVEKARADGVPVSWNKERVNNDIVRPTRGPTHLDVSNLFAELQNRKASAGLGFELRMDEAGVLSDLYVEVAGARHAWAHSRASGGGVVLFDTTHGTNRYALKLGIFSTVDGEGRTRILGIALYRTEDEDSFAWSFKQFSEFCGGDPAHVLTDEDTAIAAAVHKQWPDASHVLCTFHLFLNFYKCVRLRCASPCPTH